MSKEWKPIGSSPQGVLVETKVDDGLTGERNVQPLRRSGSLWFIPKTNVYVYYTPTHWRPARPAAH